MRSFLLLVFVSGLIGCSTLKYVEPQEGDRARVRFATNSESITVVRGYSDLECNNEQELMRLRDGPLVNSAKKSLGMPLSDFSKNAAKEVYFRSSEEIIIMFFGAESIGNVIYSCAVPLKASFQKNRDYELFFDFKYSTCQVVFTEIVNSDGVVKRVAIETFYNTGSKGCISSLWKSRWY